MALNLINDLHKRELIFHITDQQELSDIIHNQSIALYCGFDPTADSLHIGHLLPLITLKRFQVLGHKPIVLIGGATSLIGDPSFKKKERGCTLNEDVMIWTKKIMQQISCFLDFNCGKNSALLLNNYVWFDQMNILSFLRDIGKHFSINTMISKDSVKHRINRLNQGISFTEFSYALLQAYDFFILNKKYGVSIQIGGSDQWGNIASGMHLINKLSKKKVYGITLPLLMQKNGMKFGKTESGTIWLDSKKTSPYKFYQFWINIEDELVYNFLKFFTFESIQKIFLREEKKNTGNSIMYDKKFLAKSMTYLVHGKKALLAVERISTLLFLQDVNMITESDFQQLEQDGIPTFYCNTTQILKEILVICGLAESKSRAKNMIYSNAIFVNSHKIIDQDYIINNNDKLFNRFTLLTRGKKNHCLICWGDIKNTK